MGTAPAAASGGRSSLEPGIACSGVPAEQRCRRRRSQRPVHGCLPQRDVSVSQQVCHLRCAWLHLGVRRPLCPSCRRFGRPSVVTPKRSCRSPTYRCRAPHVLRLARVSPDSRGVVNSRRGVVRQVCCPQIGAPARRRLGRHERRSRANRVHPRWDLATIVTKWPERGGQQNGHVVAHSFGDVDDGADLGDIVADVIWVVLGVSICGVLGVGSLSSHPVDGPQLLPHRRIKLGLHRVVDGGVAAFGGGPQSLVRSQRLAIGVVQGAVGTFWV